MRVHDFVNSKRFYLCDGGLETFMIFEKGYDLPCFSAAVLLDSELGKKDLKAYYETYIDLARQSQRGFVLDAPTWRAGTAWAKPLGMSEQQIMETNFAAVRFVSNIRAIHESKNLPILVNGLVGPAADAYAPDTFLSANEAFDIHVPQIHALGKAGVDIISAMTLTYTDEAIGIALAAKEIDVPVVIAFTLEIDGNLPNGQSLCDAINEVDSNTGAAPIYYMINCAHPDHFRDAITTHGAWNRRIGGLRSNASRMSHAELDEATSLDEGDPEELGRLNRDLLDILPNIHVLGGCCGTDQRHVGCMAMSCKTPAARHLS